MIVDVYQKQPGIDVNVFAVMKQTSPGDPWQFVSQHPTYAEALDMAVNLSLTGPSLFAILKPALAVQG